MPQISTEEPCSPSTRSNCDTIYLDAAEDAFNGSRNPNENSEPVREKELFELCLYIDEVKRAVNKRRNALREEYNKKLVPSLSDAERNTLRQVYK